MQVEKNFVLERYKSLLLFGLIRYVHKSLITSSQNLSKLSQMYEIIPKCSNCTCRTKWPKYIKIVQNRKDQKKLVEN